MAKLAHERCTRFRRRRERRPAARPGKSGCRREAVPARNAARRSSTRPKRLFRPCAQRSLSLNVTERHYQGAQIRLALALAGLAPLALAGAQNSFGYCPHWNEVRGNRASICGITGPDCGEIRARLGVPRARPTGLRGPPRGTFHGLALLPDRSGESAGVVIAGMAGVISAARVLSAAGKMRRGTNTSAAARHIAGTAMRV